MNSNTKIEIAVEIIANKIAKAARENDEKIDQYIKGREEMYNGNEKIINKIIEEYGNQRGNNLENDNNLEQLIQEYQLTKEEHSSISRRISEIFFKGKTKPKIPTAIFTIGPPGSGKTGLQVCQTYVTLS